MAKSKKFIGQVRISLYQNQKWNGFTLQRGHFFGQTEEGKYYVSGLERNEKGAVKVYFLDEESERWKAAYLHKKHWLVQDILLKAIEARHVLDIDKVTFFTDEQYLKHGFKLQSQPVRYFKNGGVRIYR